MKKLIILIFAVTFFTACKKDYTCRCTNTTVRTDGMGGYLQTTGESTEKFSKVSKKYAREHCTSTTDVETTGSGVNEVKTENIRGCVLN